MNHTTLDPNTKMYIDNVELEGSTYMVTGWLHCESLSALSIQVGENEKDRVEHTVINRPDVKLVYPELKSDSVGFSFKITKEQLSMPMYVTFSDRSKRKILENFIVWAVMYTGFNRTHKDLIIVDNFYSDPDLVRTHAINNMNYANSNYHKGKRTQDRFIVEGTKERFEQIIGRKVTNWNHVNYANGVFQYCTPLDPIVYHVDTQTYAAMVFLTPDAPLETGTAFYKSKYTGATEFDGTHSDEVFNKTFKGLSKDLNFYDSTQYELMDTAANVYNRLVLFNAKRIHAATKYFGDSIENARFFQLFFFDVE
jgi:hypothetical protein